MTTTDPFNPTPRPGETCNKPNLKTCQPYPAPLCGKPAFGAFGIKVDGQWTRIAYCFQHRICECPEIGHYEDCRRMARG